MSGRPSIENLPRYVSWLGVVFGLELLVEVAIIATTPVPRSEAVIPGIVTSVPFVAGLIYGGYRLSKSSIGVERYGRIATWCLGGLFVFLSVNVLIMPALPIVSTLQLAGWIRWASSIGASVGFLIGGFEARAIHREVVAERGRISHERSEARRDLVDYLDSLLDREIAPRADAIGEGVDHLAKSLDGDPARDAADISRQARTLRSIVEHTGYLIDPDSDAPSLESTNLAGALADGIADPGVDASVTVECDFPDGEEWYVLADRLLPEAFEHLVSCLIDRDDCTASRVFVTCEATPETVTVRIGCEGVTIPENEREALTAYGRRSEGGHASELALVGMLTEYYGGSVELAETGEGGSVFVVTLRRVAVGADDQPSPVGNRGSAPG